jgi:hypothetical protein
MKNRILTLIVLLFLSAIAGSAQSINKVNPVGTWKFAAPYAPEGYSSGTIVVGFTEQKHTTTMSFTGSEYKLEGENVKAVNDSILFSIFLEGQDIKVMLKIENDTNMSGKAVYTEGEVPLSLSRILTSDVEVKQ